MDVRRSLGSLVVLGVVVGGAAAVTAQEPTAPAPDVAPIDLLAGPYDDLHVSAYAAQVPPQVRVLRSAADAAGFAQAAWGKANDALHIDYTREQIVVVAWGALRFAESSAGTGIDVVLERAELHGTTLHATVRTVIPPGPGIDIAADQPGRTWYPSLFFRTPRTDKVVLDVVGARRHGGAPDLVHVRRPDLVVRIGPDACPARERVTLRRLQTTATEAPEITVHDAGGETHVDIAWGTFGSGFYTCTLVGVLIDGGVARLHVRAENRAIVFDGGPPTRQPGLALLLPKVDRVALHVERVGIPLDEGVRDFVPQEDARLRVTVDTAALRRSPR